MAEQPALLGRRERRAARELDRTPDIVDERRRQHELGAQPRMELRRLAAERRDADRVLEQAAGVGVVVVGRRRVGAEVAVGEHRPHGRGEPGVRDLLDQELEEALELGGVAAQRRRQRRRVDVGRLERAHVELEPVAELLDPAEHAHRVALGEAPVEQLDVVPDARVDVPGRVDELEHEVRRAALRPQPPLRLDGEDALDDPVGFEVGDHHPSLSRPPSVASDS